MNWIIITWMCSFPLLVPREIYLLVPISKIYLFDVLMNKKNLPGKNKTLIGIRCIRKEMIFSRKNCFFFNQAVSSDFSFSLYFINITLSSAEWEKYQCVIQLVSSIRLRTILYQKVRSVVKNRLEIDLASTKLWSIRQVFPQQISTNKLNVKMNRGKWLELKRNISCTVITLLQF